MIRRLLAREEAGMADLLLHYGPLMRYIIAPILPNPQDREDCLSEVTLRVWEKIEQYDRKRGSWNAWLTAITRNTALNHARKALGSSAEELPEDTPAAGHTPEEAVLQRERQEAVRDALERLPYRDRILFYRKYYYMQPTAQIAAELGMTNTTFHNACGLDTEGHLSTARDVAVMSCQILNTCPEVLHYTGIWTDTLRGGATQLVNTNKLLHRYNGITGLKTGTTGGAGVCISASAARDGLRLVAVILGAPSSKDRFEAAAALLDYGFGGWQAAPLPAPEVQPLQLKVKGSAEDSVPLDYSALPQTVLLPREGTVALTAQACLPQQLEAPVEKGQTVGTVQVYHGETLLGEYEVKAAADAPRMDFGTAFSLLWGSLTG